MGLPGRLGQHLLQLPVLLRESLDGGLQVADEINRLLQHGRLLQLWNRATGFRLLQLL